MSDTFLSWYFAHPDERLANGDGRRIVLGETHKVTGPPVLCHHGLHASPTVLDALQYAKSTILYRVSLGGEVVHGGDKSCATDRTYLSRLDATSLLHKFARECALSVVDLWDAPDVVRRYLTTCDESCRAAARAAAHSAAWDAGYAAHSAARAAARDAAHSAAWDAARYAAHSAARAAARDAAWDAAWTAAWAAYKQRLEQMVLDAINEVRP